MKIENEREFLAHLKSGNLLPVYFLYGQEHLLIDSYAGKLVAPFEKGAISGFNLMKFEGRDGVNIDDLADACEALPLMAQKKCVFLQDIDPEKLSSVDIGKFEQLLSDPPESCLLVITMKAVPDRERKKAAKLLTLCQKKGCTVRLDRRSRSDIIKYIKEKARVLGCEMDTEPAELLLESCGNDMLALGAELEKLCAYAAGQKITKNHIRAVASVNIEAGIFDLSSAILRRDYQEAMEVLGNLLYLREPPVAILSALSMSFTDIYKARQAKKAKKSEAEAAGELGYYGGSVYRYKKAAGQAARFSDRFLAGALNELVQADLKLKSSRTEERIILEETVTKLFILMQQEAGR